MGREVKKYKYTDGTEVVETACHDPDAGTSYYKQVKRNVLPSSLEMVSEAWFAPAEHSTENLLPDGTIVVEAQTVEVQEGDWSDDEKRNFVTARRYWCEVHQREMVHYQVIRFYEKGR